MSNCTFYEVVWNLVWGTTSHQYESVELHIIILAGYILWACFQYSGAIPDSLHQNWVEGFLVQPFLQVKPMILTCQGRMYNVKNVSIILFYKNIEMLNYNFSCTAKHFIVNKFSPCWKEVNKVSKRTYNFTVLWLVTSLIFFFNKYFTEFKYQ